ncbi:TRAFs-binding domain-containing protein [Alkalinema pantanalense CENA528]|uniref:TRAFs-binding domain-containing protein n=1 Tax=Alkalinema pantanalense TaxID=1620705 RepID=UPI003D6F593A
MQYQPQPIETAHITLTAEYLKLAEILARNSHDIWVQQRLDDGWHYGPQYDLTLRQHPYLVNYNDLPDREQQSRRVTVSETLKALLALGYRVEVRDPTSPPSLFLEDQDLAVMVQGLTRSAELNLSSLLDLRREIIRIQPRSSDIYRAFGDALLQLGEPLMAYDALAEGLRYWPQDLRLQQLLALALARSGSTVTANQLLVQLVESGQEDEETIGLLARTHKDLWQQATDPTIATLQLGLAYQRYQQAYQQSRSVWTGINAATLALVKGDLTQAQTLAQQVRSVCLGQLSAPEKRSGQDYWRLATLGEAALILGDCAEAEDFYGQAATIGQGRFGDLSSSRRNAVLLAEVLGLDTDRVKQWFQIPKVVVFCGHMLDRPDRPQPRFPAALESVVYRAILERLQKMEVQLGYAPAACGADILFLEAMRELKGELHIVLPCNREQFIQDSVDLIPSGDWGDRFDRLMQDATELVIASGNRLEENDVVYEYSHRLLYGLAKIRADQLGTELIPLAVWDGKPGDGPGGTASTVANWRRWTDHVEVIDLAAILREHQSAPPIALGTAPTPTPTALPVATAGIATCDISSREIRALLFADVVNFSHLEENQHGPFAQYFWGAIAALSEQYPILMKNTWGDALYFVFPTVQQAGEFALALCDLVQSIDWSTKSLPAGLNLRIALHAGPVERTVDPITGQLNYVGMHVSHTARIEPITPPGKVYASQAFAAIAASEDLRQFTCDYVGQMPWAKRYGTFPTYHVRRVLLGV